LIQINEVQQFQINQTSRNPLSEYSGMGYYINKLVYDTHKAKAPTFSL